MGPSCLQSSEAQVRKGHLTGLKPVVLVTFQSPVNFHHWKIEQLQIQMEAAPFRSEGGPGGAPGGATAWPGCGGLAGGLRRVHDLEGEAAILRGARGLVGLWEFGGGSGAYDPEGTTGRPQQGPWPREGS